MNLYYHKFFCLLLLTIGLSGISSGQITSSNADATVKTGYSKKDFIFAFYQTPAPKIGSLTATVPDTGKATIQWSKYDTITKSFKAPFKSDANVHSTYVDTFKVAAGYRIHITRVNPKLDTTFTAWVAFNRLAIAIDKDGAGAVPYFRSTCDYFDLITNITNKLNKYRYFSPDSAKAWELINKPRFKWRAGSQVGNVFSDTTLNRTRVSGEDIPTEKTDYFVEVTDFFGLTQADQVTYNSIITRAHFSVTYDPPIENLHSAPFKINFTNDSKNGDKYTWYMGDGDTLKIQDLTFEHIYYQPDSVLTIKLISESKDQCIDTFTNSDLSVAPPQVEWPNVFVPRGDAKFNFRFIHTVSLHFYRFIIFTKLGKKIYEESAFDSSLPKGWDGKIGNGLASEGIYYYTLEILHWDPRPNPAKVNPKGRYSGFFYLYHPD
jgi:hypothetical protein